MPKFNKTKGFSLKSGNKPAFKQMGSSGSPGKMYGAPGKMYNAPLKAEDGTEETTKEVTEETEEQKKARLEKENEEKKEPVKPRDSNMAIAGKFAANMLLGGMKESGMIKDKHSLAINYGPKKGEEAGEALTIGQKMLKDDYELGDLTKDNTPKYSLGEYKKPSTKIQGSLR